MSIKKFVLLVLLTHLLTYSLTHCLYTEGFNLVVAKPKIITPNDDNKNDMLIVSYENPNDSNVSGTILTVSGYYVADMLLDISASDNLKITWNGKNYDDEVVSSGIYIYQIEVEGKIFNGTVVVAK